MFNYLSNLDLNLIASKAKVFVETGMGYGNSLRQVLRFPFDEYHTCEIHKDIFDKAFYNTDKPVTALNIDSITFLRKYMAVNEPIFFCLDAHFPGADFGYASYFDEKDNTKRIPIYEELRLISSRTFDDIIAIDDWSLWRKNSVVRPHFDELPINEWFPDYEKQVKYDILLMGRDIKGLFL